VYRGGDLASLAQLLGLMTTKRLLVAGDLPIAIAPTTGDNHVNDADKSSTKKEAKTAATPVEAQQSAASNDQVFLAPALFKWMKLPPQVFCEPNVILDRVEVMDDVRIGLASYMNYGMLRPKTRIGRYCSIGRRVTIGAAKHPIEWLTSHPFVFEEKFRPSKLAFPSSGTTIGNDVWIGDNALIIQGLTVGDGAIIGASAVVTKDVPPYAIVGGVPAKLIRWRFPKPQIDALMALRWWRYHPQHLARLQFDNIDDCIARLERDGAGFDVLDECHVECKV
jgi:virginiamycin A acetyltransferase